MDDQLWKTLMRFHREVMLPEFKGGSAAPLFEELAAFRRETNGHFEKINKRLDGLEIELHALTAAVGRVEERLSALEAVVTVIDQKLDRMAFRSGPNRE